MGLRSRGHALGTIVFGPLAERIYTPRLNWLRRLPTVRRDAVVGSWPVRSRTIPEPLRTVPGIWRDAAAERAAYDEEPLHALHAMFPKGVQFMIRHGWQHMLPCAPRLLRAIDRAAKTSARSPAAPAPQADSAALTEAIVAEAARLGLSRVGFAPYDEKYAYKEFEGHAYDQGTVIVTLLEQSWELTQELPTARAERHVLRTYHELVERTSALAEFLHAKGFRAQPHPYAGHLAAIHYGVEAGLGQLGLNGQLLTPEAGSRLRIGLITTNASLVHCGPADYGIHAICDQCQICVKRCPPGAIPRARKPHRGIVKAKIRTQRCLPVMAQAHGCGICMKVCPVQRYGLDAVIDHWSETGEILGKGTDELEGYNWIDGKRYGPGAKPRITPEFVHYGELDLDPHRIRPVSGTIINRVDYKDVEIP